MPQPYYGLLRIPDREVTIQNNAVNRLAGDYAQVYFPSQEFPSLTKNYEKGYLDPWRRPSRYAPFIHYMCVISFCKLEYGYASFLHMLTQLLFFYLFFVMCFRLLKIESDLWLGLFLVNIILFATPAGLSWFERGQFSLYVALAYLLAIVGFIKNKPLLVIVSTLFAYVKWTSFPFMLVIFVVNFLGSKNKKDGMKNIQLALMCVSIILLASLAFRSKFIHFLEGLYAQELHIDPVGISLTQLLPEILVKGMPLVLIFLGYLCLRRNNKDFSRLIPYMIGSGILLLTYPTVAFEYNIPNLFCFVPLVFYWTKFLGGPGKIIRNVFFLFLFIISFPNYLNLNVGSPDRILSGYLAISMVFLFFSLFPSRKFLLQTYGYESSSDAG